MSRKTSFKEQMFRALNDLNCFGQSKYQAKLESYRQGQGYLFQKNNVRLQKSS